MYKFFMLLSIVIFAQLSVTFELSDWDKLRQKGLEPGKIYSVSSGTGFFVNQGIIVTNEHVVRNCINITVRGAVKPSYAKIIATDPTNDIALLVTNSYSSQIAYLRLNNNLHIGEKVFAIGYPLSHGESGEYILASAEIIASPDLKKTSDLVEFTANIEKGNSGGPLIDGNGNVVGVIQAKKSYYIIDQTASGPAPNAKPIQVSGIAIGLNILKEFLKANGIFYASNSTYNIMSDYRPDNRAKDYIVNIHCVHPKK